MAIERFSDTTAGRVQAHLPAPPSRPPPPTDPHDPPQAPLIAYSSIARWLLVLVLAASAWFFHDFLVPVLAAMIIAFASWPLNRRLRNKAGMSEVGAAGLLVLVILLFLVIPLVFAIVYAVAEVQVWVEWAVETTRSGAAIHSGHAAPLR